MKNDTKTNLKEMIELFSARALNMSRTSSVTHSVTSTDAY